MLAYCLAGLLVSSCAGPAYYWQASAGHLRLMSERQDVDELLANPATHPQLRERLQLASALLDFARRQLDLPADGSYQSLVEVGGPVTWNVVATPEFSLEPERWCFPVAGCVTYRGYFDRSDAERFAQKLAGKGFDVAVSPAAAYSTLGWFDDPLLDTMLAQPPSRLAAMLFHELAHQRLYVKGDTAFNEAYAGFMEQAGVRLWLQQAGDGEGLQQWRMAQKAAREFTGLLLEVRERLAALYRSAAGPGVIRLAKQDALAAMQSEYRTLVEQRWQGQDYFGGWMQGPLNNAHLATISTYARGHCAFAGILDGAEGNFITFHEQLEPLLQAETGERGAWLEQECAGVASALEL